MTRTVFMMFLAGLVFVVGSLALKLFTVPM